MAIAAIVVFGYVTANLVSHGRVSVTFRGSSPEPLALLAHLAWSPGGLVLAHLVYLLWAYARSDARNALVEYLALVFGVSLVLLVCMPSAEGRYFGIVFLPVALLYPILLSNAGHPHSVDRTVHRRPAVAALAVLVGAGTVVTLNTRRVLGLHVAREHVVRWMESHYDHKHVVYVFWRGYFPTEGTKNTYKLLQTATGGSAEFIPEAARLCASHQADFLCLNHPLPHRRPARVFEGVNRSLYDTVIGPLAARVGVGFPTLYLYDSPEVRDFESVATWSWSREPSRR